jgi:hypothetical protein
MLLKQHSGGCQSNNNEVRMAVRELLQMQEPAFLL